MKSIAICSVALILVTALRAENDTSLSRVPDTVPQPGYVEKVASPLKDRSLFYLFRPGHPALFGVASSGGAVLWKKSVGFRPLVNYAWAADGRSLVFVTDCVQAEAELHAPRSDLRSYFFILDANRGDVLAEGDLDTDILDLPHKLPDAVGAAHMIDTIQLADGRLSVTISHRKIKVSGSRLLSELPPKRKTH